MKALATGFALLFSISSYASHDLNHFEGRGIWKDTAGMTGNFTESIDKTELSDTSFQIVGKVQVGDQVYGWSSVVTYGVNETFTIADDNGQVIGDGYCFYGKVCHLEIQADTHACEETLHFEDTGLHIMGSKVMSGRKIMYAARLAGTHVHGRHRHGHHGQQAQQQQAQQQQAQQQQAQQQQAQQQQAQQQQAQQQQAQQQN